MKKPLILSVLYSMAVCALINDEFNAETASFARQGVMGYGRPDPAFF